MGGRDPGAAAIFLGGAHVREDGGRPGFVHRGRSEARVPAEEAAETVAEVVGGRRRWSGAAPRSPQCCRLSSRLLALHAPRPRAAALRLLVPRRRRRTAAPRAPPSVAQSPPRLLHATLGPPRPATGMAAACGESSAGARDLPSHAPRRKAHPQPDPRRWPGRSCTVPILLPHAAPQPAPARAPPRRARVPEPLWSRVSSMPRGGREAPGDGEGRRREGAAAREGDLAAWGRRTGDADDG
ncbi:hypothetical protein PVAP13_2KG239774 [Panicum virgatum]|uniref:Uncharacterized protein n=1 Tax=Panicum virgatum TaxID=38727 RepID=A0A8T0W8H6_PANVG|nr:hypothetical protein PVAP13_2KG239774 [Panicum virgatum]